MMTFSEGRQYPLNKIIDSLQKEAARLFETETIGDVEIFAFADVNILAQNHLTIRRKYAVH